MSKLYLSINNEFSVEARKASQHLKEVYETYGSFLPDWTIIDVIEGEYDITFKVCCFHSDWDVLNKFVEKLGVGWSMYSQHTLVCSKRILNCELNDLCILVKTDEAGKPSHVVIGVYDYDSEGNWRFFEKETRPLKNTYPGEWKA